MLRVWVVGRVNVGKSTLFNRVLGTFRAIVTDIPGTTRELLIENATLWGKPFLLIDSPGLEDIASELTFIDQIIAQADVLFFVVDGRAGPTPQDDMIKQHILRAGMQKKTALVANKLDQKVGTRKEALLLAERYDRGFDPIIAVSAQQGDGIDTVQEYILPHLAKVPKSREEPPAHIPLAIVGRPNTGKSTLLNTLLGEQIAAVSDKAGTTLDYITGEFTFGGKQFWIYDTAGMRKQGKTSGIERVAYDKTRSLINYIKPVTVVLIDLVEWLTHRDKTIIGDLIEWKVPIIIACNKADTMEPHIAERTVKQMLITQPGWHWIQVVRISGKEWFNLPDLLRAVQKARQEQSRRLPTSELNDLVTHAWLQNPPRFPKNKACKIKYITQMEEAPPTFYVSVNNAELANFSFQHWLENVIRKAYGLVSVPLIFRFVGTAKDNPYDPSREEKSERAPRWAREERPARRERGSASRPERRSRDDRDEKPSKRFATTEWGLRGGFKTDVPPLWRGVPRRGGGIWGKTTPLKRDARKKPDPKIFRSEGRAASPSARTARNLAPNTRKKTWDQRQRGTDPRGRK